jgi:hypothetical protein
VDLWIATEFALLENLPKTISVVVKVNSTNMSDDESDLTGSQMNEAAPNDVRHLKRQLEEMEKENRRLKQLSEKRQRRAPKKTVKGENFKPLSDIKQEDRLSESQMYVVAKSIRTTLFRNVKYLVDVYRDGALQHAFRHLNLDDNNKKKYTDYIVNYTEMKITIIRNNVIHALKKQVLGLDGAGKSRQMNVASIRSNTSTN